MEITKVRQAEEPYFGKLALKLLDNGYPVIPVRPRSKKPLWGRWPDWCSRLPPYDSVQKSAERYPNAGIGFACGHSLCVIDIDEDDPQVAERVEGIVFAALGPWKLTRYGRNGRRSLFFGVRGDPILPFAVGKTEVIGEGRFTVAYGIHPDTGMPYRWDGLSPEFMPVSSLTDVSDGDMDRFRQLLEAFYEIPTERPSGLAQHRSGGLAGRLDIHPIGACQQSTGTGPQVPNRGQQGRVTDGRDRLLTKAVFHAFYYGRHDTIDAIEAAAWSYFETHADLSRPKRNGSKPWTIEDARDKVRKLFEKDAKGSIKFRAVRTKDQLHRPQPITTDEKAKLEQVVHQAHHQRLIPRSAVTVHQEMIELVAVGGTCHLSIRNLATRTGLKVATVNKARTALRDAGIWAPLDGGGWGKVTHYVPILEPSESTEGDIDEVQIATEAVHET